MKNLRKYGKPPYSVVVVHGGPGAAGEMAIVAKKLSSGWGVLEPLQTATSLEGQVQELQTVLKNYGDLPVTLIGFSWGAMLGFIFTAKNPSFVKKLILIGSGVFEEKYAVQIMETRLNRLNNEERSKVLELMGKLNDPDVKDKNAMFTEFGNLMTQADSFDTLPFETEELEYRFDIYQNVWRDGQKLRHTGELLELGKQITCPVVAIHGDFDPHPVEGVEKPLTQVVKDFRFILLENCGHRPWVERQAKDKFYNILEEEID